MSAIKVNCENIEISNNNKICIIAGPCQLETEQHAMDMAGKIKEITSKFDLGFIKRELVNEISTEKTDYYYLGLSTDLFNQYYDF